MIDLHRTETPQGEVCVILDRRSGAISYLKDGVHQTQIDAGGRSLSGFGEAAANLLDQADVRRVLVLGHGGGAAATLLHSRGVDIVSVDCDARAEALGRLFFRAPASMAVIVEDAALYVSGATPASFDSIIVDFQDSAVTPSAYLSAAFWQGAVALLRAPAFIIVHISDALRSGDDWESFKQALATVDLDAFTLSDDLGDGDRWLVSLGPK
jgi:predicted membrane-bound spermidine synthase